MLEKLKKKIKKEGIVKVSSDLGYRSLNTIGLWIKANEIPKTATERVRVYLKN